MLEISEKHDSGEIIADKNQTWRTAYAFVSAYQSLSNLNRKLSSNALEMHIEALESIDRTKSNDTEIINWEE